MSSDPKRDRIVVVRRIHASFTPAADFIFGLERPVIARASFRAALRSWLGKFLQCIFNRSQKVRGVLDRNVINLVVVNVRLTVSQYIS